MRENQGGVFDGFYPPASTDGSYLGTKMQIEATQTFLEKKFEKELLAVKARLRAAKTKVGLTVTKDAIQLQASLPIKPGDTDTKGTGYKQYKISIGIPANLDGLKTAEEEAHELGKLIARKTFEWTDKYLGKVARKSKEIKTIGEVLEDFETEYFKTHKMTEKSKHTFSYYKDYLKRLVGLETLLVQDAIDKRLAELTSDSARYSAIKTLKVLKSTLKLENLSFEGVSSRQPKSQARDIPSDEEIIRCFHNFENYASNRKKTLRKDYKDTWKMWQWVYGMLATYGLRPREIFVKPDIDWWFNAENKDNTWKVHPETKTGYREALPLHPEWVQLFNLKDVECMQLLNNQVCNKESFADINFIRMNCSSWFNKVGITFTPYDLRHAWAIRAHIMGIPIKAAADNLGHSVEIHTEIYQRWFSLENRKKVIKQAIDKKDDYEALKAENELLKAEINYLKQVVEEYKRRELMVN